LLSIDPLCRERGLTNVFAAGDATDFPIKHGGIAAQQADVAAQTIATMADAPVQPPVGLELVSPMPDTEHALAEGRAVIVARRAEMPCP